MRIKKAIGCYVLYIKEKGIEENYNSYDEAFRAGYKYCGGVI